MLGALAGVKADNPLLKNLGNTGTKYSNLGTRHGMASAMDSARMKREIEDKKIATGGGKYNFKLVDDGGYEIRDQPLNFGGRLMYPKADGTFTVWDETAIEEEHQRYKDRENFISQMMEYCLISNEMAESLLGSAVVAKLANDSADPEFIMNLNPQSVEFSRAMQTLRKAVRENIPIVEKGSKKSDLELN